MSMICDCSIAPGHPCGCPEILEITVPVITPQFDRVRALHWCPHCKREKSQGLIICWSCNNRLKRAYNGTWGKRFEKLLPKLDAYLFDHNESAALSWLGEA